MIDAFAVAISLTMLTMAFAAALLMPRLESSSVPPRTGENAGLPRAGARAYFATVTVAFGISCVVILAWSRISAGWALLAPLCVFLVPVAVAFGAMRQRSLNPVVDREAVVPPLRVAGRRHAPFPIGWYALALLLTAAVIAWGVSLYPSMPGFIPVPSQEPSGPEAVKSIWTVFALPLVGLGALTMTFALAAAFRIATSTASGASPAPQGRGLSVRRAMTLLGQIALLTALHTTALAVLTWKVHAAGLFTLGFFFYMVVLLTLVVIAITRSRLDTREQDAGQRSAGDEGDNAHWKYGMFYYNRDDPSFLVPKRYGIGWTVNFAQPRGAAFFFILLGILAVAIVAGLLGPG